jgi:hypothetical protein
MTRAKGTGAGRARTKRVSQRPAEAGAREAVSKAIKTIEGKLKSDDFKATITDFVRLLQLEKELREDDPKEIKVTWVEPSATEPVSEK